MTDWTVRGRRVKPFAFASCLAVTAMLLGPLYEGPNEVFDFHSPQALVLVVAATTTVVLFVVAWIRQSETLLHDAYLLTAGVFAARAMFGFLSIGGLTLSIGGLIHPAPWISVAWAVAAAGAYMVERGHGDD